MIKKILTSFFFLCIVVSLWGNNIRFQRFGLEMKTITSIVQDQAGFLWLGTQEGLYRYDGYNFELWNGDSEISNGLKSTYINNLLCDDRGQIWIASRSGLFVLNPISNLSTPILSDQIQNPQLLGFNKIKQVVYVYDARENSCAPIAIPLNISEIKGHSVKSIRIPDYCIYKNLYSNGYPANFTEISNGEILFALQGKGLFKIDSQNKVSQIENHSNLDKYLIDLYSFLIPAKKKNAFWMISKKGEVLLINKKGKLLSHFSLGQIKNSEILHATSIVEDSENNLWISTQDGLWFCSAIYSENVSTQLLKNSQDSPQSLSDDHLFDLLIDQNQMLWATSRNGVNLHNPASRKLHQFTADKNAKTPLSNNTIWGMTEDAAGFIWAGSSSGLNKFKLERIEEEIQIKEIQIYNRRQPYHKKINAETIIKPLFLSNGKIALGTKGNGLFIFDPKTEVAQSIPIPMKLTEEKSTTPDVLSLYEHQKGKLLVGSRTSVIEYDIETQQFSDNSDSTKLAYKKSKILFIYQSENQHFWCGTYELYEYDKDLKLVNTLDLKKLHPSFKNKPLMDVQEDKNGLIWVATMGGGLMAINREDGSFQLLNSKNGLANDYIMGIEEDHKEHLWITTHKGVSRINVDNFLVENFGKNEGLPFSEFNQISLFKKKDGTMLFGGIGLLAFHPNTLQTNDRISAPIISDLIINYKGISNNHSSLKEGERFLPKQLVLTPKEKMLAFEFTSLDFVNVKQYQYAYRLKGFDENWTQTDGNNRIATFTNLSSGNYVFEVKAIHDQKNWSEVQQVLIKVLPPFWATWWFRLISILIFVWLIVGSVYYFSRRKLKKQLQALELKNQLQEERERISRDLHDNVGSHLTYIISKLDLAGYQAQKKPDSLPESLFKMSRHARDTMQLLRQSIWALNQESFTLEEFKIKIQQHLQKYLEDHSNLKWSVEVQGNPKQKISPSQALNLFRIIQEAINNVIKHAEAESLQILLEIDQFNNLNVQIQDNGKGLNESSQQGFQKRKHYGLLNMQNRVKEMNGHLEIDSEEGKGTNIEVVIPL